MSTIVKNTTVFNEESISGAVVNNTAQIQKRISISIIASHQGDQLCAAFMSARGNVMHPSGVVVEIITPDGSKLNSLKDYSYAHGSLFMTLEQPGMYQITLSGRTNEKCKFVAQRISKGFSCKSYIPSAEFETYARMLHTLDDHLAAIVRWTLSWAVHGPARPHCMLDSQLSSRCYLLYQVHRKRRQQ